MNLPLVPSHLDGVMHRARRGSNKRERKLNVNTIGRILPRASALRKIPATCDPLAANRPVKSDFQGLYKTDLAEAIADRARREGYAIMRGKGRGERVHCLVRVGGIPARFTFSAREGFDAGKREPLLLQT